MYYYIDLYYYYKNYYTYIKYNRFNLTCLSYELALAIFSLKRLQMKKSTTDTSLFFQICEELLTNLTFPYTFMRECYEQF